MSKSKPQRMREKMVREGKMDPQILRGSWNGVAPVEKKTPTVGELRRRQDKKYKKWDDGKNDHSIFSLKKMS